MSEGDLTIYISGLYSGTNPQPGVGIARSLRQAYPKTRLVGVEYSNRCSGIHWQDLDDVWLQRPWEEIDLDAHAEEIRKVLESGSLWISSIDLEILWLGTVFKDGHPNLLIPPPKAVEASAKPAITAHSVLPVTVPEFISTEMSDWKLHEFCREHNWNVWLKGPYYDAIRITTWQQFTDMRALLSEAWSTEKLFLQAHVSGYEESICLTAYRGKLVEAISMRKKDLTDLGKTWAGDVRPVDPEFMRPLAKMIKHTGWTGGAELEMVRDADNRLWLIEMNPRFPAWIHGATITGFNLPASLVYAASRIAPIGAPPLAEEFTRVVVEIPVKREYPLSPLPEPLSGQVGHSLKHPSGLLQFADRLHKAPRLDVASNGKRSGVSARFSECLPGTYVADLNNLKFHSFETPASFLMAETAKDRFASLRGLAASLSHGQTSVSMAYSFKTNPDARLISLAKEHKFYAETISLDEVRKATNSGFPSDRIILNGPGKWWGNCDLRGEKLHAVFCDSLTELRSVSLRIERGEMAARYLGLRLRTPNISSRFGIPIDTPDEFQRMLEAVKCLPDEQSLALHFHVASSAIGVPKWLDLFRAMLRWSSAIETLSGRSVGMIDIGGGWFPDDLDDKKAEPLRRAISMVPVLLPNVREVVAEPGKALAQPSMAVAMRILEIRDGAAERREVIVDGSIAELPMYRAHPHRVVMWGAGNRQWCEIGRGKTDVFGRLCMEDDIVARDIDLPPNAEVGDVLVFCDAGAYDRSMSYVFGRG